LRPQDVDWKGETGTGVKEKRPSRDIELPHRAPEWIQRNTSGHLLICFVRRRGAEIPCILLRWRHEFTTVDGGYCSEGAGELRLNVTHVTVPLMLDYPLLKQLLT
jgi:hypothetical protein